MTTIWTIGFTQTTAEGFFQRLKDARIERLLDVRLRTRVGYITWALERDLPYFLDVVVGASYEARPQLLAPTPELFKSWKDKEIDDAEYDNRFRQLMVDRQPENVLVPEYFDTRTVLLCSEADHRECHRRLIVEHLQQHWDGVEAVHL